MTNNSRCLEIKLSVFNAVSKLYELGLTVNKIIESDDYIFIMINSRVLENDTINELRSIQFYHNIKHNALGLTLILKYQDEI